jgi:hypothetical protein
MPLMAAAGGARADAQALRAAGATDQSEHRRFSLVWFRLGGGCDHPERAAATRRHTEVLPSLAALWVRPGDVCQCDMAPAWRRTGIGIMHRAT